MSYYSMYEKATRLLLLLQIATVVSVVLVYILSSKQKKKDIEIAVVEYDYYNNARATVTNDLNNIDALVMHAFNKKGVVAVGVEIEGSEVAFYSNKKQLKKDGKNYD